MEDYTLSKKLLLDTIQSVTGGDPTINEYVSIHKEILDTKFTRINQQHFKTICDKLKNLPQEIEDLEINLCTKKIKCLLTQEKILEPFYSTCGHVFERRAINEYLMGNKRICPNVGCKKEVKEKQQ
uniref:SP-RING-type domain-containing protein n=1 Tax=Nosema pernyi TaxID=1112939 RepID=X5DYM7_9MICR|nr:hypothetical protein NP_01H05 [Nosema pernyi]